MRVLLINPPYPFEESPTPPFGLISLAAYLIEQGAEVRIEDYIVTPYSADRARRVIGEFRPDVIGATAVTMNVKPALSILADCKEAAPGAVTVMGGPHVTFDADAVLREYAHVDYIVRGEGELTFHEMLSLVEAGRPLGGVLGISYRDGGVVRHNPMRPFIEDINMLPYPARQLISLGKYRALGFPINMVTSRGCPHKCIFCVGNRMVGNKVRYFDVTRVVDEFELLATMGFKQINIVDDLFTSHKRRCIEICDEIVRRGIRHPWTAFARVDTVSEDLLAALKRAGCTTLCFGIESGNQEILDLVKKKITLEKARRAVELCRAAGIDPMTSYILGLPGETPETVRKTMEFAKGLSSNYGFHILAPFPGTEVREKSDEYGMRILTSDWDLYDANRSVAETEFISHEEIDRIVNEFNGGLRRIVIDMLASRDRGETLPPQHAQMVQSLVNFLFARDLIVNELVENYNGAGNGCDRDAILAGFAAHVSGAIGMPETDVRAHLERLVGANCIAVCGSGSGNSLAWN